MAAEKRLARRGGMRGRAEDLDPPGGVLDDRQDVHPRAGRHDGLEEVAGEQGPGLRAEETGPGGSGALGCRVDPAPRRTGPTWKQFQTAQARGIIVIDFVHVDTVLLRRIYALIVAGHGTRRAHLAGITAHPDGAWTTRAARSFLMDLGDRAAPVKFLIRDRAGQFTSSSDAVFTGASVRILASTP